jgi:hypothetical protein
MEWSCNGKMAVMEKEIKPAKSNNKTKKRINKIKQKCKIKYN